MLKDVSTLFRNRIRISEYDAEYDKLTIPTSQPNSHALHFWERHDNLGQAKRPFSNHDDTAYGHA